MKKVIPASTRRALAARAMASASLMEFWTDKLIDEMKKQNFDPFFDSPTEAETVNLSPGHMRAMISNMRSLAREIRRLAGERNSN